MFYCEFVKVDKREFLFAATAPLEALSLFLPFSMTEGVEYRMGRQQRA